MKKTNILLLVLFNSLTICLANGYQETYSNSLESLINQILSNEFIEDDLLINCIPRNSKDALTLFGIDYKKSERYKGMYSKINSIWSSKFRDGNEEFFIRYLEFSKFVDGYFAEDYFDDISGIIESNKENYCIALKKCNSENIKRLDQDICK